MLLWLSILVPPAKLPLLPHDSTDLAFPRRIGLFGKINPWVGREKLEDERFSFPFFLHFTQEVSSYVLFNVTPVKSLRYALLSKNERLTAEPEKSSPPPQKLVVSAN